MSRNIKRTLGLTQPSTALTMPGYQCRTCLRSGFATQRGLYQHYDRMHPTVPKPPIGEMGHFVNAPHVAEDHGAEVELEDISFNDPEAEIDEEMDDVQINEGVDERDFDEDGNNLYGNVDTDKADDEELESRHLSDTDDNLNESYVCPDDTMDDDNEEPYHPNNNEIYRDMYEYDSDDEDNIPEDNDPFADLSEVDEDDDTLPPHDNDQQMDPMIYNPLMMNRGFPGYDYLPHQIPITLNFMYTADQLVELMLYNLLRKLSAPNFGWDLIKKWAAYAQNLSYDFSKGNSRATFLAKLSVSFNMNDMQPKYSVATVDLRPCRFSDTKIRVIHFSVEAAIRSLLNDPLNHNPTNVVINANDPFAKYVPINPNTAEEVLGADIYQDNFERFIPVDPNQNYLIFPICLYADSTHSDRFGNFHVHPVMLSSTFYAIRVRRLYCGWRLIGLIPDVYIKYSPADRSRMNTEGGTGYAIRNLHSMLRAILAELIEIQHNGGIMFDKLTINGVTKYNVLVITPIHMVLGDMQGSDAFAGKGAHHKQISRACHCPFSEASNTRHRCVWKTREEMMSIYYEAEDDFDAQVESCIAYNQVPVDNVFWELQFLDNKHSIHGCSPFCLLHLLLQGIYMYVMNCITDPLNTYSKGVLDDLCRALIPMMQQSGAKNDFPGVNLRMG